MTSSSGKGSVSMRDEGCRIEGDGIETCLIGDLQTRECHKHLDFSLVSRTALEAALTTPELKGAPRKKQNYWSFVNLLPNIPRAMNPEALWLSRVILWTLPTSRISLAA